jgi:hypothetical protein
MFMEDMPSPLTSKRVLTQAEQMPRPLLDSPVPSREQAT